MTPHTNVLNEMGKEIHVKMYRIVYHKNFNIFICAVTRDMPATVCVVPENKNSFEFSFKKGGIQTDSLQIKT
jgi:hypothetical protein